MTVFTAITFSPVTEFIEKTRKLRDLYGSSFILSHLTEAVCLAAQTELGADAVVSPALLKVTMGTPDQVVIAGDFTQDKAKTAFDTAWGNIVEACRDWVSENCNAWIDQKTKDWVARGQWSAETPAHPWDRDWKQWRNHAWEFFWVQAATLPQVLEAIDHAQNKRNWQGINWLGESSTLSGADAIAWPGLGLDIPPKERSTAEAQDQIRSFLQVLNLKIGEAILQDDLANAGDEKPRLRALANRYTLDFPEGSNANYEDLREALAEQLGAAIVTNREQLSIPELTKRLFTLRAVSTQPKIRRELPRSFKEVNLWRTDLPMGWFRGDGDQAGRHAREIAQCERGAEHLQRFSQQMRGWAKYLKDSFDRDGSDQSLGRIIFAGGDDFLGVFYPSETPTNALQWLERFKSDTWQKGDGGRDDPKPITPSLGFVWASSQIPQRDILQHCELAEQAAKQGGRDRIAFRILFSGGNYLQWVCPWWLLEAGLLDAYGDRNGKQGRANTPNWTHIYNDVATLQSRHAFAGETNEVAMGLFEIYFGETLRHTVANHLFNREERTGILGNQPSDIAQPVRALNQWIINLARVGFHLCSNT